MSLLLVIKPTSSETDAKKLGRLRPLKISCVRAGMRGQTCIFLGQPNTVLTLAGTEARARRAAARAPRTRPHRDNEEAGQRGRLAPLESWLERPPRASMHTLSLGNRHTTLGERGSGSMGVT
jgi:hypothetical protein